MFVLGVFCFCFVVVVVVVGFFVLLFFSGGGFGGMGMVWDGVCRYLFVYVVSFGFFIFCLFVFVLFFVIAIKKVICFIHCFNNCHK